MYFRKMNILYLKFIIGSGNNVISSDQSSVVRSTSSGSLVISKVEASMKGQYTCKADNGFGEPLTKTIELYVRGKLELKITL